MQERHTQLTQAIAYHQSGQWAQAETLYREILSLFPNDADALHLLGILAFDQQDFPRAVELMQQAIACQPQQANFYNSLGNAYRALNQLDQAKQSFRQALALQPDLAEACNNLGAVTQMQGQLDEAVQHYQQALTLQPDYVEACCNLGMVFQQQGRYDQAVACFERALALTPHLPEIRMLLGTVQQAQGLVPEAVGNYREALQLAPDYPEVHYNLGNALKALGQTAEAISHYRRALDLAPDFTNAHFNLANTLMAQGEAPEAMAHFHQVLEQTPDDEGALYRLAILYQNQGAYEEAIARYQQLLEKQPGWADIYNNQGLCFQALHQLEQAIAAFTRAVEFQSDLASARRNLANALREQGELEAAMPHYQEAARLEPGDGPRIRNALLLPPVYRSAVDLLQWRAGLEKQVDDLQGHVPLQDPYREVGMTNFYLAYQGCNDKELQSKIARLYRPFLPATMVSEERPAGDRKRIGFISGYFYNQSVSHYYAPMIQQLPKDAFHVTLLATPDMKSDHVTEAYRAQADEFVRLPNDLAAARELVAAKQLDILVYTDIGMDPFTYFLAFTRLAPVQCVLLGHPVTTGIDTLDYFVSGELFEGANAQDHYSETLVAPPGIPADYPQATLPAAVKTRSQLGLPEDRHLYVCPMTLFKIQPDFDQALAGILRQDPAGEVILFQYQQTRLHQKLQERFQRDLPDVAGRIRFLPWSSWDDFLTIMHHAEAVLDTFHFSGANTAFMALALAAPMITWPSPYMRGRLCHGLYRRMEMDDCVARDQGHYVELACQLGMDRDFRQHVQQRIRERSGVLFNNPEGVREMIGFLAGL